VRTTGLTITVGLLAFIAYGDVRTRRIPNAACLGIVILGLARIVLAHDAVAARCTLAAAAAIFAAAFLLFWRGAVGGGDVKLMAAMVLLIGHHEVVRFLLLMSVYGGVLALAMIARNTLRPYLIALRQPALMRPLTGTNGGATPAARSTIPYGVAIAAAGVITILAR
jgi:prepilin peptidase CpaA